MSETENLNDVDASLLNGFVEEAREHMQVFGDGLLRIDKSDCPPDVINSIFRAVHTIKGCARTLGCVDIGRVSHVAESALDALRKGTLSANAEVAEALFEAGDLLNSLLDDAAQHHPQGQHEDEVVPLLQRLEDLLKQPARRPLQAAKTSSATTVWPSPGKNLPLELVSQFIAEAADHLAGLETALLAFEKAPNDAACILTIFRLIHSIKGTADYVGLAQIKTFSHRFENVLDLARYGRLPMTERVFDLIFEAADALRLMINSLATDGESDSDLRDLVRRLDEVALDVMATHAAPAGQVVQPVVDAQLMVFVQAASQHIESMRACRGKIGAGDLSEPVVSALRRSAKTLMTAAQYMDRQEFLGPSEQIFDLADLYQQGKVQFDDLMLGLIDEQSAELTRLLEEARKQAQGPETPRLGDILCKHGIATREQIEEVAGTPMRIGDKMVAAGLASRDEVETAVEAQAKGGAGKAVGPKTMRVDQVKLDGYINLAGELLVSRNGLVHAFRELQAGKGSLRQMKEAIDGIARICGDIQDNAMAMRMVPVKTVFQRFPRMIRDIAKTLGKQVDLQIVGEDTELDKQVAEALGDPLVHLVRNAADHGVEMPAQRRAAGKNETGTVVLRAAREGSYIIIDITDDGGGIHIDRLKTKAVEMGVITQEQAEAMPRSEALNLIFAAGLSTAKTVSDISGRGVGMDVVRNNILSLGGSVAVASEEGKGTQIRIQLPLTLAVTTVVLARCNGATYALPMESVGETVKVLPQAITPMNGQYVMSLRGQVIGLKRLADLLALDKPVRSGQTQRFDGLPVDRNGNVPVTIVSVDGCHFGLLVDDLLGQQDIVVKPLPGYLAQLPGLGGATIMGDGSIVLVLDAARLFSLAAGTDASTANQAAEQAA